MICHVCEQQAIGQCKSCGKFYCRQHGDVYCVRCGTAIQPERQTSAGEFKFGVPPASAPAASVPAPCCYACLADAGQACGRCERYFCPRHSDLGATAQPRRVVPLCAECADLETAMAFRRRALLLVAVVIGITIFVALLASSPAP
jgi:hypothetical protein